MSSWRGEKTAVSIGCKYNVHILPVMVIRGSRDRVEVFGNHRIDIGDCHSHTLDHWLEHYRAIGRKAGYTHDQIEEYGAYLETVRYFLERFTTVSLEKLTP